MFSAVKQTPIVDVVVLPSMMETIELVDRTWIFLGYES